MEDNITFELPLEYRETLVAELTTHTRRMDDEDDADSIALNWQVMVCNIIREVLEGRPANTGFWLSLENCTQSHLEFVFTVSVLPGRGGGMTGLLIMPFRIKICRLALFRVLNSKKKTLLEVSPYLLGY